MDKQWIENTKAEKTRELKELRQKILDGYKSFRDFDDEDIETITKALDKYIEDNQTVELMSFNFEILPIIYERHGDGKGENKWTAKQRMAAFEHVHNIDGVLELYQITSLLNDGYDSYLDSEPQEFDGDIIITDPCYIARHDDWGDKCNCGWDMQNIGLKHSMVRDTLYGDWGCTVFDDNSGKVLGKFCADAGMVGVFLLNEILAYNPDYKDHTDKTFATTLIKDFKGTVRFIVKYDSGVFEEDSRFAGEKWEEFSVSVVGHGINKKTGECIDFHSTQTSL